MNKTETKNTQSNIFFTIVLLLVLGLTFVVFQPFFTAIIMAFIVAMIFAPVYKYFYKKSKNRPKLANALTILTVSMAFIIPMILLGIFTTKQLNDLRIKFENIVSENAFTIEVLTENVNLVAEKFPGVETVTQDELTNYINEGFTYLSRVFFDQVLTIGATSVEFLLQFFVFLFVLITIIPNMGKIRDFVTDLSPLRDELDTIYIEKTANMVLSMVNGTLIIALVQTLLSVIFLYIAGVEYLLLIGIILFIVAIIPLIGTAVLVIPIGVIMIVSGNVNWGLFIIITNVMVVSSVDNILRPWIVSGKTSLNSALILISILGGIRTFGPFGFIYGPVIMILAVTTIDVYKKYYRGNVALK